MTVSYTAEVATSRRCGCFLKLLGRWRASIYKLIWFDLLIYLSCFYSMSLLYRVILKDNEKRVFEDLVRYCRNHGALIPLSFVLGFYVAIIVDRWWNQYISVPWPDTLAVYVSSLVRGMDEHGRLMRRTIMRYVCLSLTMVLTMISPGIKRRFPTYDYLIEAGLLNKNEANILIAMDEKFPKHFKYWMPIMWAASIFTRARKEGRIWDDFSLKSMIDELNKFRSGCNMLIHYDTISVPLVYTQVVTLAVYTYFLATIFGHQYIDSQDVTFNSVVNSYFPVFGTLEFFFFMGWLKVAETLICPFGDDDDDFELNWAIDRNLQVSYLIVDEMHNDHPTLVKDQYWDEVFPNELPYADESQRQAPPEPSTAKLDLSRIINTQPKALNVSPSDATDENDFTNFDGEDDESLNNELRIRFASRRFNIYRSSSSISFGDFSKLGTSNSAMGAEEDDLVSSPSPGHSKDDFDRLRDERERERQIRQLQHAEMTLDLLKSELINPPHEGNADAGGSNEPLVSDVPSHQSVSSSAEAASSPSSTGRRTKTSQTDKSYVRSSKQK